jgi:hypothetical protein
VCRRFEHCQGTNKPHVRVMIISDLRSDIATGAVLATPLDRLVTSVKRPAQVSISSGSRRPYRSMVMTTETWPRIRWTTFGGV